MCTKGSKHGPAGVDDLDLAVASKGLGVSRESSCVPSVVTCIVRSGLPEDSVEQYEAIHTWTPCAEAMCDNFFLTHVSSCTLA